ncbi:MAG: serine/threonine-protein kinase RsbW [Frankiaceae bacterium]|jgi:serine/threonine-protein kinase RsbW|nr:serine/threonine-protein kinase RsbW [Frankiaceae bacterium]
MTATPEATVPRRDVVSLRLPADGAYLAVLRTAAAGLASRLDFTLDDIEDLRIAVDEACAMLLPRAADGAALECAFELKPGELDVSVSLATTDGALPSRDTFAWTVLTALAGEVDASADGPTVTITMAKKSSTDADPHA